MIIKSKKTSIFSALALIIVYLASCTAESIETGIKSYEVNPNEEVLNSFDMRYPDAKNIVWSIEKKYYVADFDCQSKSMLAWFTESGDWALTTKENSFNQLLSKIADSFLNSRYSDSYIEKIYSVERKDMGSIHVICVSDSASHLSLYYSVYGDLIKTVSGSKSHRETPVEIPAKMGQVVDSLFENPEIIDFWEGPYSKNVAVLDDSTYSYVAFDSNYEWIGTYWYLIEEEVPLAVIDASIQFAQNYPNGPSIIEEYKLLRSEYGLSYLCCFVSSRDRKKHIAFYEQSGKLRAVISY
ncbi:hypothetical protein FACS189416_4130 [Bacteroidia bacterium]|nr:hypothetical protein FACS189416_4130 [Bacteroidia bacterium]